MAYVRCPQCNTVVQQPATGDPVCPNCGFGAAPAPPAKKTAAKKTAAKKTAASAAAPPPAPAWAAAPETPPMSPPPMSPPPMFSDPGAPVAVTSGKAVAAMVVGIAACCLPLVIPFIGPFLGLPAGIVALVLGIIANKECNADPQRVKGKGMAITGIVLGSIMVVLGLLMILVVTIFIDAIADEVCEEDPDSDACRQLEDYVRPQPGPLDRLLAAARAPVGPASALHGAAWSPSAWT